MKQNIYIAALLAGMLALAGCGGGSGSTKGDECDAVCEANKQNETLKGENETLKGENETLKGDLAKEQGKDAETLAMKLHEALKATPGGPTPTFDGTMVMVGTTTKLTKTTDSVSDNVGWTGGHFAKDKQEARVYWRAGTKEKGKKFSEEFPNSFSSADNPGLASAASNVLTFGKFSASSGRIEIDGVTGTSGEYEPKNKVGASFNLPGSYYGVRGTYQCTGTGTSCIVTKHADEARKFTNGRIWTFTPTNADDMVADPKNVYAYYGWWLDTGAASDNYAVNVFSGTTTGATAMRFAAVGAATTGTATYEGGAAGKYAIYSSVPKAHESGHFTANAKLTADFDTPRLTGTIDKFMVDGKEKADWSIELTAMKPGSGPTDPPESAIDTDYNETMLIAKWKIDDETENGTWGNVHFHDVGKDKVPNHVTGQFDAANNRAEITGAFGATK